MPEAHCLSRETLKQYLVGCFDDEESSAIENHLSQCDACEQTVVALESEPDTLCSEIREAGPAGSTDLNEPSSSPTIDRAIESARRIPALPVIVSPMCAAVGEIGAYELFRPLGRGGMGTVMAARHKTLGKRVAVKLLPVPGGEGHEQEARFEREVRAAGRLNHPCIINATDAGIDRGLRYLVMEYVTGLDLSRVARLAGPLSIADACEITRQVALGLAYAHREGMVHRDIKPSNLMLDQDGRVKILDFGLVQISDRDEMAYETTTVGRLMGTLDYMAPEQAERAGSVDLRADLFALGATLFRLLVGHPPLSPITNLSLLDKVRLLSNYRAPKLSAFRPDIPPRLSELVESMLQPLPELRPGSADHVADKIAEFCSGSDLKGLIARAEALAEKAEVFETNKETTPEVQPPVSLPSRSGGSSARSKWGWAAAAAAALLFTAAILITLEIQKGVLVIQSEVAGVQVNIARDGQVVDKIQVEPGAQSTRLRADRYEITLDSPSDQIVIDRQTVELKSGKTVVATIKEVKRASPADRPVGESRQDNSADLLYDGKSLAAWLDILEHDVSLDQQKTALPAILQLARLDTNKQIIPRLIAFIDRFGIATEAIDKRVGELLKQNYSLVDSTLEATENSRSALLSRAATYLSTAMTPQEFETLVLHQMSSSGNKNRGVWYRFLLVHPEWDDAIATKLLDPNEASSIWRTDARNLDALTVLLSFEVLGRNSAWAQATSGKIMDEIADMPEWGKKRLFRTPARLIITSAMSNGVHDPTRMRGGAASVGEREIEEAIARLCVKSIHENRDSSDLTVEWSRLATSTDVVNESRDELVADIRFRLEKLIKQPDLLFKLHEPVQDKGRWAALSYIEPGPLFIDCPWCSVDEAGCGKNRCMPSELVALLALVRKLKVFPEFEPELTAIADRCRASWMTWGTNSRNVALQVTQGATSQAFIEVIAYDLWLAMFVETLDRNWSTDYRLREREFCENDLDRDGVLSEQEYRRQLSLKPAVQGQSDPPFPIDRKSYLLLAPVTSSLPMDESTEWARRQIEKYDQNRDGMLDKAEWQRMIVKPDGADLNGDGFLTVEEYAAHRRGGREKK